MIRAVIDTNVLVSGLMTRQSPPATIRRAFADGFYEWSLSVELYGEYKKTFAKPKVIKAFAKAGLEEAAGEFMSLLKQSACWVETPLDIKSIIPDDPDDDVVLATAVAAGADVIVSGDEHLLGLRPSYEGILIQPPREFLETLRLKDI